MMAATYAPPAVMFGGGGHGHGHSHGHSHSHGHGHSSSRKSTTQRAPLQPTSTNGELPLSGRHFETNSLKSQIHSHSAPFKPTIEPDAHKQHEVDQVETNIPVPSLQSSRINTNGRPNNMERRRSSVGLPTHLRLGSSGYGFAPVGGQKYVPATTRCHSHTSAWSFSTNADRYSRRWITAAEAVSALVLPLPYMVVLLAYEPGSLHQHISQSSIVGQIRNFASVDASNHSIENPIRDRGLFAACALTSITLLLTGLKGKLGGAPIVLDRRKHASGKSSQTIAVTVRQIVEQTFGIGLPFYATLKLGGDRVALIMLIALTADITNVEEDTTDLKSIKDWRKLIKHRQWTLASITVQILCDLVGLTAYSNIWSLSMGYVALALSVLFIPPPFPSLKPKYSSTSSFSSTSSSSVSRALATQWESRTLVKAAPSSYVAVSPLISTSRNINLTLAASITLGALTCITFFMSTASIGALSLVDIGFGVFSAFAAALSFQLVQPHSLRQNSSLGLALGSVLYLVLMAVLRSDIWNSIAYQGIFIGVSFVATKVDIYLSLSASSSHSEHQIQNQHSHAGRHGQPSRFSELLLKSFQHWPLLHSILVEKDSRRIFYFMW